MLTLRACRVLKIAAWKGEDWILAAGKSPADYAAETLISWATNQLRFSVSQTSPSRSASR